MLCVLAYCPRDQEIVLPLLNWMSTLGDLKPRHTLLLVHDARCPKNVVQTIMESARGIFTDVRDIEAKAQYDTWPEGANYMWRTATTYLANIRGLTHFLWLEPDAIPLKTGWLDQLEDEYKKAGKPFLGDRVEVGDIPLHMSGIGVYPNPIYNFAGEANRAHDMAWDMFAKDQIIPQAHFTELIEHAWKHPSFTNPDELKTQISDKSVLFHASKDGSLINLLIGAKQQRSAAHAVQTGLPHEVLVHGLGDCPSSSNEGVNPSPLVSSFPPPDALHAATHKGPIDADKHFKGTAGAKVGTDRDGSIPSGSHPIYDIFIRTYPVDYPWLQYCLRSINQYAKGFRKITIVSPEGPPPWFPINEYLSTWIEWKTMNEEAEDGYLSQQIHKLYADSITNYEADYILHIDSDTLFTRPVKPEDFFHERTTFVPGKLVWYYTPYEHTETPWKVITQKFLGEDPPHEFMRRLPMMVPSWLYPKLREFSFHQHQRTLSEYIKEQPYREFSEFNALGAYAWFFHHDKIHWVNTMEGEMPAPFARQFYSWGGLTEEVKAEIQNILSGGLNVGNIGAISPKEDQAPHPLANLSVDPPIKSEMGPDQRTSGGAQTSSGGVVQEKTVMVAAPPSTQFNGSDDETPGDHVRWLERYIEGSHSRRQYVMQQLKKARLVPLRRGRMRANPIPDA